MRPVFFDENSIGAARLCEQNEVFESILYSGHPDIPEITPGTHDIDFFPVIGAEGKDAILITRDKKIRTRPIEIARLRESGIRTFIVTVRRNLTKTELYQLIAKHSNEIVRLDSTTSPPYIFSVRTKDIAAL